MVRVVAVLGLVLGVLWYVYWPRTATIEICNLAPYDVTTALHYQSARQEWQTDRAVKLAAGECRAFARKFYRVTPAFYLRATASGEIVSWMHSGTTMTLSDDREQVQACPGTRNSAIGNCARPETFGRVPLSFANASKHTYSIYIDERDIPLPHLADGTIDIEAAQAKIRLIAQLLPRRKAYLAWRSRTTEIPYESGALFDDADNLMFNHGVTVTAAVRTTPLGVPIPFETGDRLIELDGREILGVADYEMALIAFAQSREKGVGTLYPYRMVRGDQVIEGKWTFYFNERFFGRNAEDEASAFRWGLGNSATFGLSERAYCGTQYARVRWNKQSFDYDECVWTNRQLKARLKQMYQTSYDNGSLAGLFVGGLGTAVATKTVARMAPRLAGSALATEVAIFTAAGAVEAAAWTYAEAAPGADVSEEMKRAVRNGAGVGFAVALLAR